MIYGRQKYGIPAGEKNYNNLFYGGVPVGIEVKKQIGHHTIFRCRRGNGFFGSVAGKHYQDKYPYFVPSSINNTESDAQRALLAAGVSYWKNTLSAEEQAEYNKKASRNYRMSGYNLFMREVLTGQKII